MIVRPRSRFVALLWLRSIGFSPIRLGPTVVGLCRRLPVITVRRLCRTVVRLRTIWLWTIRLRPVVGLRLIRLGPIIGGLSRRRPLVSVRWLRRTVVRLRTIWLWTIRLRPAVGLGLIRLRPVVIRLRLIGLRTILWPVVIRLRLIRFWPSVGRLIIRTVWLRRVRSRTFVSSGRRISRATSWLISWL